MTISAEVIDWAKHRGIGQTTLEALGVVSGTGDKAGVVAFPYRRAGAVVNVKYRATGDKRFWSKDGGEQRFWNLDAVLASSKERVFIVEGEMDACALVEAGVPVEQVLSVPNGAPGESVEDPAATARYEYVFAALEEGLSAAKRFVLVTDGDEPGRALRNDLVRILGAARCWFVEWPEGTKDANGFLLSDGVDALRELVLHGAMEWPVTGLYRLSEMPEPPEWDIWDLGYPEFEKRLRYAPGILSIMTGEPGHGKTLMAAQLWFNVARRYGIRVAVASFETKAKPHYRKNIRQFYWGKPQAELTEQEAREADDWIEQHILWLSHPNSRPSLKWVLDMAEVAVVRHNVKGILVDPWNKLESARPDRQTETEYVGEALDSCMDFAQDMGAHVQIIAHPAKVMGKNRKEPPLLSEISGSKNFENRCDLGLSVHRPVIFDGTERKTESNLYVLKSRYDELGYVSRMSMEYGLSTGRFRCTDYDHGLLDGTAPRRMPDHQAEGAGQ